jgi:hypothetical protein
MECRAWANGGAHWAEQDRTGKALREMCDPAAQWSR